MYTHKLNDDRMCFRVYTARLEVDYEMSQIEVNKSVKRLRQTH